jgi:protein-S-isoprenylcysteine O-methyltransferase Ste14
MIVAMNAIKQQEVIQGLTPRQVVYFIFITLSLLSILLICGWDLAWWQGWVYMIIMAGMTIGGRFWAGRKNPGLLAERARAGKAENVKTWDKTLSPLMALSSTLLLCIVAGLDHRFGWSPVFPVWLTVLGLALVFLGYAFGTWAMLENRFFSGVVRIQSDRGHEVCDSGPYRIVRHPGYASNFIALPGIALGLGSLWTIIPVVLALVIGVIRTSLEDRTLREELPGYGEYAQRTRYRLIPGIY